ncbi:FmdB family zinc ribbon protein [Pseudodesulfovibrio senegalensis]|uniref:Zinc ribbon domain-containing protein n=1 Tax=Pseudodesulfovibrio senegalensis TaxID=1721087 RepID=A0A6N6N6M8_9BACT|nr:zinc ribbon domain-containing protein [Pseudodesulfovibrio senegalensis]KAB1443686.1 zinc ribbon domain-containing protein [Pseudodesulfovibrio senegalensis]
MPIFEYRCHKCEHVFEEIASFENKPPCPACGSSNTEKLLSPTSSLTGRETPAFPDGAGHGCCGSTPGKNGCVPGTCCGKNQ